MDNRCIKLVIKSGSDICAISLQFAKYIDSNLYDVENIVTSNGLSKVDAMSIASVAGRDRMTIILSRIDKLNTDTYNWLKNKGLKNAYIIVSQIVLSNNILTSINATTSLDISVNRSDRVLSKTSINSLKLVLK